MAQQKTRVQQAFDALDIEAGNAEETTAVVADAVEAPQMTATKRRGRKLLWLFVWLLMGVVAAMAWWMWQQNGAFKTMQSGLQTQTAAAADLETAVAAQVAAAGTKQAASQVGISDSIAEISTQLAALSAADTRTEEALQALSTQTEQGVEKSASARTQMTEAEMAYLIKLAQHRLVLAHDVAGATTALGLADEQARRLGSPALFSLRTAIAEDMQVLAASTPVDVAGMAARLQAALSQVDALILTGADQAEPVTATEGEVAVDKSWQDVGADMWDGVRSLVVISRDDSGIEAVAMPEQQYFLRQNLRLKLDTARLALLRGEQAVYDSSLTAATQWLSRYFEGTSRDTMVETLTALQGQAIVAEVPAATSALAWLAQRGQN